MCVVT